MSAAVSVPTSAPAGVRLEKIDITTKRDRTRFIRAQWNFYRGNPAWVPPLLMERHAFLDPKANPFFENAEPAYWLAYRGGEVVGRIGTCLDRNYNKFQETKTCEVGFFECIDDQSVANALFDQAKAWAKEKGLTELLGPGNFNTNHECGLLLDSYDRSPFLLYTYNPAYYVKLWEGYGFKKAKDLYEWDFDVGSPVPERVTRIANKIRKKENLVVRPVDLKDLEGEIARIERIYNDAWEKNWGFVPMTDHEFQHMAKDMKQLVIPELCLIAEVQGEPVAFAMTLPDINKILKSLDGKLFPFGFLKFLLQKPKLKACRLVTLGVRKGFRKRGIDAVLYHDTHANARELGFLEGDVGWTLEDNDLINRAIEMMGGKRSRTFRYYTAPV